MAPVAARVVLIALLTVAGLSASPAAAHTGRASITGTYMTLASGRVQVSVRSDAARVKLAYRTRTGRYRSKFVRVRDGEAAAVLAKGSRDVTARALRTSRLRASARVSMRPNPLLQDMDGNGTTDYQYDLDTDGRYELVLFDNDQNGRFEAVFLDAGVTTGVFRDHNDDGFFEFVAVDADRDGNAERMYYDGDRDGYPEFQCLDAIGPDGVADTWFDTRVSSGNPQQDGAANDLMVQNIVALNQLRQLDPWSTAYIPYDPAPSLLR